MRYGSVCSGIEAATAAWHSLGWQPAFFSEIEPFPCAVLSHHYPTVPNHGDMTKFEEWPDAAIDLLVGGTPCQSFSVAGLRKGLSDPRGNLMLTFGAIARRYRPTWLVWENVPGVLSSNGGRDFGTFLGMLGELGYGFAYRVLDAQFFGVAQRRRRVFVVANARDWRRAAAVLFERHSLSGHPAPRREAGEGTAGGSAPGAGGGRWPAEVASTLNAAFGSKMGLEDQHALSGASLFVPDTAHTLRGEGFDASEDGTGRGTPIVPVQPYTLDIRGRGDGHNLEYRQDGTANALLTPNGGRGGIGVGAVAFGAQNSASQGDGVSADVCATLDKSKTPGVMFGAVVRRLTPRECERLQGFRDDYTLIPHGRRIKPEKLDQDFIKYLLRGNPKHLTREDIGRLAADGPRYKALGNSMAVPCMRWLGERIQQVAAIQGAEVAA